MKMVATPRRRRINRATQVGPDAVFTVAQWSRIAREMRLSCQQRRVVKLIFTGLCDKQIASAMGIAVSTVHTHVNRLFVKLDVHDRVEVMREVVRTYCRICQ